MMDILYLSDKIKLDDMPTYITKVSRESIEAWNLVWIHLKDEFPNLFFKYWLEKEFIVFLAYDV